MLFGIFNYVKVHFIIGIEHVRSATIVNLSQIIQLIGEALIHVPLPAFSSKPVKAIRKADNTSMSHLMC
jgi:hypothetical protein